MRATRWIVPTVCIVIAGACGARVQPLETSAGNAGNNTPSEQTTTTAADNTSGNQATATTTAASSGGGTNTGGGTNPGGGATASSAFNYDPAAEAAACTGTAGNTASDVGVTPTSINLGNVAGLTGVITNEFEQGAQGVQALFSAINAHGGICGRQLKLTVEDDGQDASRNEADVRDLIPKVMAFVGSISDADNAGVQAMVDAKIPDIGFAINANRGQSSVFWSAAGSTLYQQNGKAYTWSTLQDGMLAYNDFPKRVAALAYAIPISSAAAKQFAYRFQQAGSQICFTDYSISPATASLDSDVLQMKRNNCDGVLTTMDLAGNAKLLQSEQNQNFHPLLTEFTFASYSADQIAVAGQQAAQGAQITLNWLPFNEPNPVLKLYLDQLKTYQPGKKPSSFGLLSWAAGQMFVQGLIKAGRNPTRAGLVSFFSTLENYDTGGVITPVTPRLRRPVGPCIIQVEVKGGDFVRKWPPTGFFCKTNLVQSEP
jgi:branched-chain amino acid transport system substrate-binding protein